MAEQRLNCSVFYLPEHDTTLITSVIVPILTAVAVLVVVACGCGAFGCFKWSYKMTALVSLGVVTKLALIPDITDKVCMNDEQLRKFQEEISQGEGRNWQDQFNKRRDMRGVIRGNVRNRHSKSDTGNRNPTHADTQEGTLEVNPQGERRIERIRRYFRQQQEQTVFFETYSGKERLYFWVLPFAPPFFLALGMVLILSYVSVFITDQWEVSKVCTDRNAVGIVRTCYRGFNACPPVNCTTWNNLGMDENLFCFTEVFDLFNPLERFVSLLTVQVTVLQFFACVVNRGCCMPFKYPPCRYTCICVLDFGFIMVVSAVMVYLGVTQSDKEETFANLIVPFLHLVFVSVTEWLVLFVFACLTWMIQPFNREVSLKEVFWPCGKRRNIEREGNTSTAIKQCVEAGVRDANDDIETQANMHDSEIVQLDSPPRRLAVTAKVEGDGCRRANTPV